MHCPRRVTDELLSERLAGVLTGRVVVVGVGDERRGDDGAGPMIAGLLSGAGVESVIDSGPSPEVDTWRIRELVPDVVLFADAVDLGGSPGDAALLEPSELRRSGFDTHRAPLRLTMQYLESELKARCYLLAVQPADVRTGSPMCAEVKRTAANLAEMLSGILARKD